MKPLTLEFLAWHADKQKKLVGDMLVSDGSSIVLVDGSTVGWLQTRETPEDIYLAPFYIRPETQNQGIGTAILHQLGAQAARADKYLTLDVLINNRARRLYERLGFQCINTGKYKLTLQWFAKSSETE